MPSADEIADAGRRLGPLAVPLLRRRRRPGLRRRGPPAASTSRRCSPSTSTPRPRSTSASTPSWRPASGCWRPWARSGRVARFRAAAQPVVAEGLARVRAGAARAPDGPARTRRWPRGPTTSAGPCWRRPTCCARGRPTTSCATTRASTHRPSPPPWASPSAACWSTPRTPPDEGERPPPRPDRRARRRRLGRRDPGRRARHLVPRHRAWSEWTATIRTVTLGAGHRRSTRRSSPTTRSSGASSTASPAGSSTSTWPRST